jgi:hypothetical protein
VTGRSRSLQLTATTAETPPPPLGAHLSNDRRLLIGLSRWIPFHPQRHLARCTVIPDLPACRACMQALQDPVWFPLLLSNCCIIMQFMPPCAARPPWPAAKRPAIFGPTHRRQSICSPTTQQPNHHRPGPQDLSDTSQTLLSPIVRQQNGLRNRMRTDTPSLPEDPSMDRKMIQNKLSPVANQVALPHNGAHLFWEDCLIC